MPNKDPIHDLNPAAALGTLLLRQVERELGRLDAHLQVLCDLVLPVPDETEPADALEPPDPLTALRAIAGCVQDHLLQAHQALAELGNLVKEESRE
jgi:hypothetical protein